ncbi:MAG: hypothetical protein HY046_12850 [Acidobacteria bacterium]|nr:hypothetical protein [Acidobacteriota bacterium]
MSKLQWAVRGSLIIAVLALTLPALAEPVAKSINLLVPAKVGRTQLDVGQYKILIDGEKVTVKQGNKVIAETTGEFVERPTKQTNNSVLVGGSGQLQEVRFAGEKRVLILNN